MGMNRSPSVNYRDVKIRSFVPGRVRLKLGPSMRDPATIAALEADLRAVAGVDRIAFNNFSGNVLITYDGSALRTTESLQVLESICKHNFPDLDLMVARRWLQENDW